MGKKFTYDEAKELLELEYPEKSRGIVKGLRKAGGIDEEAVVNLLWRISRSESNYEHESKTTYDACKIDKEELDELIDEALVSVPRSNVSQIVELMCQAGSNRARNAALLAIFIQKGA